MPLSPWEEAIRWTQSRYWTSLCSYYLARHKTTGARGWLSIRCIFIVYTPSNGTSESQFCHKGPTHDSALEQPVIWAFQQHTVLYYSWMPPFTIWLSLAYAQITKKKLTCHYKGRYGSWRNYTESKCSQWQTWHKPLDLIHCLHSEN